MRLRHYRGDTCTYKLLHVENVNSRTYDLRYQCPVCKKEGVATRVHPQPLRKSEIIVAIRHDQEIFENNVQWSNV